MGLRRGKALKSQSNLSIQMLRPENAQERRELLNQKKTLNQNQTKPNQTNHHTVYLGSSKTQAFRITQRENRSLCQEGFQFQFQFHFFLFFFKKEK